MVHGAVVKLAMVLRRRVWRPNNEDDYLHDSNVFRARQEIGLTYWHAVFQNSMMLMKRQTKVVLAMLPEKVSMCEGQPTAGVFNYRWIRSNAWLLSTVDLLFLLVKDFNQLLVQTL